MLVIKKQRFSILSIIATIVAIIALGASAITFFAPIGSSRHFFEQPYNIYRVVVMLVAFACLGIATRSFLLGENKPTKSPYAPKMQTWLNRLIIIVPAVALIFLIIQLAFPEFATLLVRKENWPFYRNAIFVKFACLIIGLTFFVRTAIYYGKKKQYLPMVISGLFVLILFVMAGEELSWGQRIFQWSTPDSIAANNQQRETSLHNFATQEFQNSLYFGTWLLLILVPFLNKWLSAILDKIKSLRFLKQWLPTAQFIGVFAVSYGFTDSLQSETGIYYGSNLFIVIGTLCILMAMIIRGLHNDDGSAGKYLAVLGVFMVILIGNLLFSKVWDHNPGAPTEYLEMFIDFGIMVWTIGVHNRVTQRPMKEQ